MDSIDGLNSLRIRGELLASTLQEKRRNVPIIGQASGVWRRMLSSLICGGAFGAAIGLLFRGICWLMQRSFGNPVFNRLLLEPHIYRVTEGLVWWAIGGALYGMLHHRHVTARAGNLNHNVRRVVFVFVLAVAALLFCRLAWAPAHPWSKNVLPFAWLVWLGPVLSWGASVVGGFVGFRAYMDRNSVYTALIATIVGLMTIEFVSLVGAVVIGYSTGAVFWTIGLAVDWLVNHFYTVKLSLAGFRWGCSIGGLIGFGRGLTLFSQTRQ